MSYVFDTSSLMAVLLDDERPGIDMLFDEHTVELAFYEAGNILWKATQLQERLDADETQELVTILEDLRLELVVHGLSALQTRAVLETASACALTFYDAAYLRCAETLEATLVTEDQELREAAGGRVAVCSLDEMV